MIASVIRHTTSQHKTTLLLAAAPFTSPVSYRGLVGSIVRTTVERKIGDPRQVMNLLRINDIYMTRRRTSSFVYMTVTTLTDTTYCKDLLFFELQYRY
jgi:hypothetical protein